VVNSKLLLITPTIPARTGHGTSMRAYALLKALSREYDVSVLMVSLYKARQFNCSPDDLKAVCDRFRRITHDSNEPLPYQHDKFDCIYVFRLFVVGYALPYLHSSLNLNSYRVLDIDDFESEKSCRIAHLARAQSNTQLAWREARSADFFRSVEDAVIPLFHEVIVSNPDDRMRLERRYTTVRATNYPNGIEIPERRLQPALSKHLTLLFVGTMDYFPNEDAVAFFCDEILPRLRHSRLGRFLRLLIVGCRPTRRIRLLQKNPEVTVIGEVAEIHPYYRLADLSIVPLRVGSGTRVKILEAFAHRCAVVSTSIGCEGLGVEHGRHLFVADSISGFARGCERLLIDSSMKRAMIENAYSWIKQLKEFQDITPVLQGSRVLAASKLPAQAHFLQ
jgi:glycosyltransferase involved in cell wall biosynthesis